MIETMKNNFFRNILAISVILVGIALILVNIGLVSWEITQAWHYIYPTLFIILGLKWCWDGTRGRGGFTSGSFLVIFGSLLLMGLFRVITFTFWDFYMLWPLLIVYIGFSFLGISKGKYKKKKFQFIFDSDDHKNSESVYQGKKNKFMIGDHKYNTPNWKVEPLELWIAVGSYHIDFTKAFIPDKDIPIQIHGWAGDIKILMPENIEFSVIAEVKAGDIVVFEQVSEGVHRHLSYQTTHYQEATRKLTMDFKLKAGSIRIDRV